MRLLDEPSDPTVHGEYKRIGIINDLARALIDHPKSRLEEARQLLKRGLEEGYGLVRGVEGNALVNPLLQVLHDALGLADFKEGFTASDPIIMKELYRSGISNFSQSIEIGEKSRSSGWLSDDYLRILLETYGRRASLYDLTGEYGSSILDWRVLIEQGDQKNPDHLLYRLSLATVLAKNGELKTAWDEIRSTESVLRSNVSAPFMASCCLCEIYRLFRFNSEGGDNYFTSNDALLRQILAHLESADGLGYFDTPTGLASLQSDPSLHPIRDTDEFIAFIDRIVAKSRAPKSVLDPSK